VSGTLPRQHPSIALNGLSVISQPPQSAFVNRTIIGHPTLRRQSSHELEPRILNRNASNVQYYYG
jgi:hypothetical protein